MPHCFVFHRQALRFAKMYAWTVENMLSNPRKLCVGRFGALGYKCSAGYGLMGLHAVCIVMKWKLWKLLSQTVEQVRHFHIVHRVIHKKARYLRGFTGVIHKNASTSRELCKSYPQKAAVEMGKSFKKTAADREKSEQTHGLLQKINQ